MDPGRGHRKVLIAVVLLAVATLAALYLSFLSWWLVPSYRGPHFPKIMMTYVVAYWVWAAMVLAMLDRGVFI